MNDATMHPAQQQRIREIDALLYECQRHNDTSTRITFAQLKALRAGVLDTNTLIDSMEAFDDPAFEPALVFMRAQLQR